MLASHALPYLYRPMTADDIEAAHALSVALKWPHRLEDWAMVQRTSAGFVAEDNGRLIGTAFACHQGDYSSIGLVIVNDEYQGKGIGRKLMQLSLGAAEPRIPILNATVMGEPLYASMGFKTFDHIEQYQGIAEPSAAAAADEHCVVLNEADHARIIALANAGSGLDRTSVLSDLLPICQKMVGIQAEGQLQGIALLRPFGRGLVIGPVVARDLAQAKAMITQLLLSAPEQFVRIDIPADCGLAGWLIEQGLKCVDRAPRMAMGKPPVLAEGVAQFGLVTQAIG